MKLSTHRAVAVAVITLAMTGSVAAQESPDQPEPDANSVAYGVLLQLGGTPDSAQAVAEDMAKRTGAFICRKTVTVPAGGVKNGCATSPRCIKKLTTSTESKRLALLTILTSGEMVRLDVQMFAADTGKRTERQQVEYKAGDQAALDSAAQKLLTQLFPKGGQPCPTIGSGSKTGDKDSTDQGTDKTDEVPDGVPDGVPDPREVAEKAESGAGSQTPPGARDLNKSGRSDRRSNRKWIWIGAGAVAVAAAATAIYFATAEEELPFLTLPPAP